ncbi:MAG: hypothetical protein LBR50_02230 [Tannerella sp.]|jgi:ABC-type phosphate transport system substrate-binding protein|nr:hypothetical protein [Tannerella sp.]
MKITKLILTAALFGAAVIAARAEDSKDGEGNRRVIYIETAKYTSPLVEKWIAEYNKTNPGVEVKRAAKDAAQVDLRIVADAEAGNHSDDGKAVAYVGRSALLPVTSENNPLNEQISKRKFGKKELKKLFFSEDELGGENEKKDEFNEQLTVYSGNSSASGAQAFASYFGLSAANYRGKKVLGDDIYLLQAISKDPTGVTVNNLSYLYDLKERKLKDGIALIPLNVRKEQLEIIRSENLDETITLLENEKVELVPVLHIGFEYDGQGDAEHFLRWIITEGQQFNHEYGFLRADAKTLSHQQKLLAGRSE